MILSRYSRCFTAILDIVLLVILKFKEGFDAICITVSIIHNNTAAVYNHSTELCDKMEWTAVRMDDDKKTTYTAAFEMKRVKK